MSAVLLALGVTTLVLINQPDTRRKNAVPNSAVEAAASEVISFVAENGKTVLAQLREKATVESKDSQFGPYVDTINGIKGGTDDKYWVYYVNGERMSPSPADYTTQGGEPIEWRFE